MQLSNYHSHCDFCDGRSKPEDFVKFALSKNFRAYGFSSHAPLPFETFWNMSGCDLPEYLEEIKRLQKKYQHKIEIYSGLEIDFLTKEYNASIPYFQELPLDYRISSIHFLPISEELKEENMVTIDGSYKEFEKSVKHYFEGDIRKIVKRFYLSSMEMVECGGFDIVGHLDKIHMNGGKYPGFDAEAFWYKKLFIEYLVLIAEKGLMVEINTKNLLPKKELYPLPFYLPVILDLKIPILVNSDTHYPDLVNDGRQEAFELLKNAGFKFTRELMNGKWEDCALT
ncbi:histidinol-phosphatase [Parabacteroides pacaensis]|uniref:histidinol-phosphatase n=1 Tax=Parabacteroides pacaensis TaxID=2086575 RepID=UPI000D101F0C|nr:histidinol-phosphatase [Parabacteroides pacaensis]